jgi:tRNA (mo5U34)-methyltransferase
MSANPETSYRQRRAREIIESNPEWYHSIELAPGVVTPGRAPFSVWQNTLRKLELPDLNGKSVLDIGAYDGFFSFAAERHGAARVVALDEYVWCTDMVGYLEDWRRAREARVTIPSPRNSRHWRPDELPGKRPFDAARNFFDSKVEPVVGNFMTVDPAALGRFDVVLFLGILYHVEDPLLAMRRVAGFLKPGGYLGIESEAVELPGAPDAAVFEFFPANELNDDASNWWAPNVKALQGLVTAAGLENFVLVQGPPRLGALRRLAARVRRRRIRYRAIAHAAAPPSATAAG